VRGEPSTVEVSVSRTVGRWRGRERRRGAAAFRTVGEWGRGGGLELTLPLAVTH
jgi:hypothetical protein